MLSSLSAASAVSEEPLLETNGKDAEEPLENGQAEEEDSADEAMEATEKTAKKDTKTKSDSPKAGA